MLYIGSKNNTEKELANYFSFPNKKITYGILHKFNSDISKSNSLSQLNIVCTPNNITLNNAFVSYINKLGIFISYDPNNPQYEANKLNNLISKTTNNLIQNIIQPTMLNNQSVLNIINTIYFYSKWKNQFSTKNTKQEIFNGISKKYVMMMTQSNTKNRYFEDNHNQVLEMDYTDNLFTMGFVLPKSQYHEAMISNEQFEYYVANLKEMNINIIKIPKFTHESKYRIDNMFRKFGLKEIFNNADLGDIIPQINGHHAAVSQIIHNSVIIVNEMGTKMSTTNAMSINWNDSANNNKIKFIADHQFLYYVRYKPLNILLIVGQHY